MFYYLNKSPIAQLILIAFLMVWAVFTVVTGASVCPTEGQSLLFQYIAGFWSQHPVNFKVSIIILLLLESLLLGHFYSANKFADCQTYMPVVFFYMIMNIGGFLHTISPAFFTMIFMTLLLLVNARDENDRPVKNRVFTSGILVGISTLVDPVSMGSVIFLLLALITHRYSKSKEIAIMFFGLLFVFAYLFGIAFIAGNTPMLLSSIKQLSFFGLIRNLSALTVFDYVFLLYSVVLLVYLIVQLKLFYDNRLIVLRKRLVTIHFMMFALVGILLFSGLILSESLLYMALPISLYFSMICLQKNRIIFHEILIVAYFVLLWL